MAYVNTTYIDLVGHPDADGAEILVEVEFNATPGTYPSWNDPGSPAEIDILSVRAITKDNKGKITYLDTPDWLAKDLTACIDPAELTFEPDEDPNAD